MKKETSIKLRLVLYLILTLILVFIMFFGEKVAPYDPYKNDLYAIDMAPCKAHIMGTDALGRDLFSRILVGARSSLSATFVVVVMTGIIGTVVGVLAGYYGGFLDAVIPVGTGPFAIASWDHEGKMELVANKNYWGGVPKLDTVTVTDLQNDHTSLRVGLSPERGIVTSAYLTLRNQSANTPLYLYYYLHSFDLCKGFYGMGAGVRQGLNWDGLKQLKIVVPPIEEQIKITDYLEYDGTA